MTSFDTSSGDLDADRRADYAEMLAADADYGAAAEVMIGALEIAPQWALGWFRLGELHETAGDRDAAIHAWRMVLALDEDDRPGASLKLALIGAAAMPQRPPSAFVETLFDQYAPTFDRSLVDNLGYRAPDLLGRAIGAVAPGRRFGRAVDLGCGTGLAGTVVRPIADDLEGHDISSAMLARASATGLYDRLVKSDLQTLRLSAGGADLIVAADVFIYVGALDAMVSMIADALAPGGLFAFTVEDGNGDGFALDQTRRFVHAPSYVRAVCARAGLAIRHMRSETLRLDRTEPVAALIVVAQAQDRDA